MGLFGSKKKKTKNGYWIKEAHLFMREEYVCSVCHHRFKKKTKTCPFCQTVMKKERYDPQWVDEIEMYHAIVDD